MKVVYEEILEMVLSLGIFLEILVIFAACTFYYFNNKVYVVSYFYFFFLLYWKSYHIYILFYDILY
jgi:hypothetical protein